MSLSLYERFTQRSPWAGPAHASITTASGELVGTLVRKPVRCVATGDDDDVTVHVEGIAVLSNRGHLAHKRYPMSYNWENEVTRAIFAVTPLPPTGYMLKNLTVSYSAENGTVKASMDIGRDPRPLLCPTSHQVDLQVHCPWPIG